MKREPIAMTQTRRVRVMANLLTQCSFSLHLFCGWNFGNKKSEGSRKFCSLTLKVMVL